MICNSGEDEVFHVKVFSALIILNYVPAANGMANYHLPLAATIAFTVFVRAPRKLGIIPKSSLLQLPAVLQQGTFIAPKRVRSPNSKYKASAYAWLTPYGGISATQTPS
ncbi:hypothetical protein EDD85DRAFT_794236 [Armillaria nabsnona]|nr:hypothetical protein EDD85DRAFT_794236 [Armillaria nabsnona]